MQVPAGFLRDFELAMPNFEKGHWPPQLKVQSIAIYAGDCNIQ
jgi:hypothetical protein